MTRAPISNSGIVVGFGEGNVFALVPGALGEADLTSEDER